MRQTLAAALLVLTATGCNLGAAAAPDLQADNAGLPSAPVKVGVALSGRRFAKARPVKVGVALDKTGSTEPNGVSGATIDDFAILLDLLREQGGEVAVGLIRETSNRPLLRLPIAPPLEVDPRQASSNPFERAAAREKVKAQDSARQQEDEAATKRFVTELRALIQTPADARKTAICQAMERMDLFLHEDDGRWLGRVDKFAVFITDGQENVDPTPCRTKLSGARVVVVKGGGDVGVFSSLDVKLFEAPGAAFSWIRQAHEDFNEGSNR